MSLINKQIITYLTLLIYLLINIFFVLKYGEDQHFIDTRIIVILYTAFIVTILFVINNFRDFINKWRFFNFSFWGYVSVFFIGYIVLVIMVDGNDLTVDRWSAMEVSAKSVLNLEYPYDKLDHRNGTSSNFPGLIFLGIPFYLLGDVGFLQPFIFAIVCYIVFKLNLSNTQKLSFLFLLTASIAYLWEVYVKSDLMSNLFLVLLFLLLWDKKYKSNYFKKPIFLAFCVGFIFLTRGVVIIPLALFLFKDFLFLNLKTKVIFSTTLVLFILLISLPILISLPTNEIIRNHNPINNQTMHAPIWIMIFSLVTPFILSFKIKNIGDTIKWTFLITSFMMLYLFIANIFEEGFNANLQGDLFDISYLGMLLPFCIFCFIQNFTNKVMS